MASDGVQSVRDRKRALEEMMQRALSRLREMPYFRLEDYLIAPPDVSSLAVKRRKGPGCKTEPLYIARPVAPRLSRTRAKRIQTYNPAGG